MALVVTANQPHAHEMQLAYRYPADEIVKRLDSDAKHGLIAAKVGRHLQRYGANTPPGPSAPPAWLKFLSQFAGPLTTLFLLAMGISVFARLNERDTPIPFEALTILVWATLLKHDLEGEGEIQTVVEDADQLRTRGSDTLGLFSGTLQPRHRVRSDRDGILGA